MANRFWTDGGVTADWSDTANWSTTDGGAGGAAVPANTDVVYIKKGVRPIVAGLGQSAVTVASLNVLNGYGDGVVGTGGLYIGKTDGTALEINVTNSLVIQNSKLAFFRLNGTVGTVNVRDIAGGQFLFVGGSTTNMFCGARGSFSVASDVEVTNFDTSGMGGVFEADATSPVDLIAAISNGASVEFKRKIHTLVCSGRAIVSGAASGAASSGTSKWYVAPGGSLDLRQSGNINQITVLGNGHVTAKNSPGYETLPAIASLYHHEGAKVDLPTSLITVTAAYAVGMPSGFVS